MKSDILHRSLCTHLINQSRMRSGLSFSPEPTDTGDLFSCSPSETLPLRHEGSGEVSTEESAVEVPLVFILWNRGLSFFLCCDTRRRTVHFLSQCQLLGTTYFQTDAQLRFSEQTSFLQTHKESCCCAVEDCAPHFYTRSFAAPEIKKLLFFFLPQCACATIIEEVPHHPPHKGSLSQIPDGSSQPTLIHYYVRLSTNTFTLSTSQLEPLQSCAPLPQTVRISSSWIMCWTVIPIPQSSTSNPDIFYSSPTDTTSKSLFTAFML